VNRHQIWRLTVVHADSVYVWMQHTAPMFATYLVAKFAGETVLHNFFAKYIVPVRVREKRKEKNG
jgi:hypothetical protein